MIFLPESATCMRTRLIGEEACSEVHTNSSGATWNRTCVFHFEARFNWMKFDIMQLNYHLDWLKCFKHDVFLLKTGLQIERITKSIWNVFFSFLSVQRETVVRSAPLIDTSFSLTNSSPPWLCPRCRSRSSVEEKKCGFVEITRGHLSHVPRKQNLVIGSQTTQGQWEEKTPFSVMSHKRCCYYCWQAGGGRPSAPNAARVLLNPTPGASKQLGFMNHTKIDEVPLFHSVPMFARSSAKQQSIYTYSIYTQSK